MVAAIALAADAFFLRKARYVEWACGVHEAVGMRLAGGKGLAASSTELAPLKAPVSANDG